MKRKKIKYLVLISCLICFILLTIAIINSELVFGDELAYELISKYLISDKRTSLVIIITNLGGSIFLGILTLILLFAIKNKKIGLCIILNLLLVFTMNFILKSLIARPRPVGIGLITETGYSFPSGHSMVNMAYYGYLIYLVSKYLKNKYIKYFLISIFTILIISIGFSRIYLGVHYSSDVIGGFLFSIPYLIIYIKLTNKFIIKRYQNETK